MIYLDTSAAFKALVDEDGSAEVLATFRAGEPLVSSRLLAVEVHAAADRRGLSASRVAEVLESVSLVSLDDVVVDRAIALRSGLRSLDALHLATAVGLADLLTGFACFDHNLNRAAEAAGLPVMRF